MAVPNSEKPESTRATKLSEQPPQLPREVRHKIEKWLHQLVSAADRCRDSFGRNGKPAFEEMRDWLLGLFDEEESYRAMLEAIGEICSNKQEIETKICLLRDLVTDFHWNTEHASDPNGLYRFRRYQVMEFAKWVGTPLWMTDSGTETGSDCENVPIEKHPSYHAGKQICVDLKNTGKSWSDLKKCPKCGFGKDAISEYAKDTGQWPLTRSKAGRRPN